MVAFTVGLEFPAFALGLLAFESRRSGRNNSAWGVKEHCLVILLYFSQNSCAGRRIMVHLLKAEVLYVQEHVFIRLLHFDHLIQPLYLALQSVHDLISVRQTRLILDLRDVPLKHVDNFLEAADTTVCLGHRVDGVVLVVVILDILDLRGWCDVRGTAVLEPLNHPAQGQHHVTGAADEKPERKLLHEFQVTGKNEDLFFVYEGVYVPAGPLNIEKLHQTRTVDHPRHSLRDEVRQLVVYVLRALVLSQDFQFYVHHVRVECKQRCNRTYGQNRQKEHRHPEYEERVVHMES